MYCPRCGSNVGAFDYCPQCGSNVKELLESLETKENTEEPAVEEAEEQASPAAEEYTVPVSETDEPATEPENSAEETADTEENLDETDTLFVDYLEPYSESENSLANYKKKSKLPKIIVAVLIPVIIAVFAVLSYENHFRYTTYKVPPLSKTDEYLLEEGSVPEHTIPPKVKTPKHPNTKRLLSNTNYDDLFEEYDENGEIIKGYRVLSKDKKISYGVVLYDANDNLIFIEEYEPCNADDEYEQSLNDYKSVFSEGNIQMIHTPKYSREKYWISYPTNKQYKFEEWHDVGDKIYYSLITSIRDDNAYVESRYDKNGKTTYTVAHLPDDDCPIRVVPYKNEAPLERWYFDSDGNYVKTEKIDLSNS